MFRARPARTQRERWRNWAVRTTLCSLTTYLRRRLPGPGGGELSRPPRDTGEHPEAGRHTPAAWKKKGVEPGRCRSRGAMMAGYGRSRRTIAPRVSSFHAMIRNL
jgi:hypothetical protein